MRTIRNDDVAPLTVEWCAKPEHYQGGTPDHGDASACVAVSRVIEPGARLTYDNGQGNSDVIAQALAAGTVTEI